MQYAILGNLKKFLNQNVYTNIISTTRKNGAQIACNEMVMHPFCFGAIK